MAGTNTYTLVAFGRRLATTGGKYNQFSKRYNPDGQTAEFNRAPKGADGGTVWSIIFNRKSWFDTYILAFRYDPQGQQILSADGGIRDTIPDENIYYGINRQTYATYSSDGEVQMISARGGAMYAFGQCAVSIIFCIGFSVNSGNTWDAPLNNEDDENQPSKSYARVYDRTFGLADGLKSKSWSVQQPFDVIPSQNGQLALETPQTAQSTSLGLNPVSVAAPNTANPPPANPVTVTPPTATPPQATPPTTGSSQPTTPTTPATPQATPTTPTTPQAATTTTTNPNPTISSPTVTAPPTGTTTTPTPTTNTPPSSNAQPIPLPAPVNTLPSTVSSAVNPTSTQSPNSTTPPPITNPTTVTAPNQVTPPPTGSSSASSVSAPVGSVPVSSPNTVKPPVSAKPVSSSVPPRVIRPLDWVYNSDQNCENVIVIPGPWKAPTPCSREDIEAAQLRLELAYKAAAGQDLTEKEANQLVTLEINFQKRYVKNRMGAEAAEAMEVYKAFIVQGNFSAKDKVAMTLMLSLMIRSEPPDIAKTYLIQGAKKDGFIFKYIQDRRNCFASATTPYAQGRCAGGFGQGEAQSKATWAFGWVVGVNESIEDDALPFGSGSFLEMMDYIGFVGLAAMGIKGLFKAFGGLIRNGVRGLGDDLIKAGSKLANTRLGRAVARARTRPGCANSFSANTKVWVAQTANDLAKKAKSTLEKTKTIAKTALTAVAISSITTGTQVLTHNEQTKLETPQTVTATINHTDPITVKLTLETNDKKLEVIEATPEHPFYALLEPNKNSGGIWVNAGELQPNNWLRRANGETGVVKKLEWLTVTKRMYNLTVARDHTFFVGDGQWLVHNTPCAFLNSNGTPYPVIIDPRTGKPIPAPPTGVTWEIVPKGERVTWTNIERGEFIAEWYRRGLPEPSGGWAQYDIHHIRPREYGGTNAFENLIPVKRDVHQQIINPWWQGYR